MTKQTKIATKILERAYARELIKAAVGQNDFGAGSLQTSGRDPNVHKNFSLGNVIGGASDAIQGGFNAAGGVIASAPHAAASTLGLVDGVPPGIESFHDNTQAGFKNIAHGGLRMLGGTDSSSPLDNLRAKQVAALPANQQGLFNFGTRLQQTGADGLALMPAFGAIGKAVPAVGKMLPQTVQQNPLAQRAGNAVLTYGPALPTVNYLGQTIYQAAGGEQLGRVIANTLPGGNQAQAAPATAPNAGDRRHINFAYQMQGAANQDRRADNTDYTMESALNTDPAIANRLAHGMDPTAAPDQTEVAQDAAATPAPPPVPPVAQVPPTSAAAQPVAGPAAPPPTAQPAPEQQSETATDYASLSPAKWSLSPNATPEQQQTVDTAQKQIAAAAEPVKKAVGDLATDPTNAEAKAAVDAAATENIVKSVTSDPAATANGATDFGSRIGAQIDWYQKQDPTTQGLLALGLSAGVIGLISSLSGGGGLGSFLSMALGLGGAGLLGAASGAFGEDGQRAMGQGMASVGRMMGMNVPEQPQDVGRLIGENAPATIHAGVMNSAPTAEEKKQIFLDTTARANKANTVRAQLKDLDTVKQIAGMPEQAAVPLLMHLGQADKKPITAEVAKQVYRNAVQTAQMASDKDSPMAKQIAIAQQFVADPDKYVNQEARNAMGPAAGYVNKGVSLVNQLTGSLFGPSKQSPR